jgi:histidine triad (HIT) family protein
MSIETIFDKILQGIIPVQKVYEDEYTLAFNDINPQAPVHVLVIPKKKIKCVSEATPEDCNTLGNILLAAKKVAELTGISEKGFRLVMNNGNEGGQTVDYIHCHVLGGRSMGWPPG